MKRWDPTVTTDTDKPCYGVWWVDGKKAYRDEYGFWWQAYLWM